MKLNEILEQFGISKGSSGNHGNKKRAEREEDSGERAGGVRHEEAKRTVDVRKMSR